MKIVDGQIKSVYEYGQRQKDKGRREEKKIFAKYLKRRKNRQRNTKGNRTNAGRNSKNQG